MADTINTKLQHAVYVELADGAVHTSGVIMFCENQSTPLEFIIVPKSSYVITAPVTPFLLPTTNKSLTLRGFPTVLGRPTSIASYAATDGVLLRVPPNINPAQVFELRISR